MTTAKLLLHCPDKPGILAEVTDFITVNKGNIIYLDQYVDHVENIFFMRIEWELKDFLVPQEKIEDYFRTLYGQKYEMDFRLYFSDVKPRMAIFVSKLSHCLFDMLARYTAGEWNVEIPLIISNHPDLQHVADSLCHAARHYPRVSRLTDSLSHTGRHNTDLFHLPALSARVHPAATNSRFGCDFQFERIIATLAVVPHGYPGDSDLCSRLFRF